ncbi:hypothetical protein HUA74_36265 [Myxococcus sp. CA051A]|uniref:hypothetical protein n=1 Tax=unclassified Myxococcus TaxID=2648731 RepID=UPI00157B2308|nr:MULTISPECIES: hypothetical protein [unclassified Myxococcus]NTX37325.1 hypothetical protein [Myxococcus sp. CA033]NTX66127.1 hypothetical protein [Myxococcus sp. CA051A]
MIRRAPGTRGWTGLALALGLVLSGCARETPAVAPSPAEQPGTITLTKNHGPLQVTPHLSLATGNFWPEDTDAGAREPTAALFIYDSRVVPPEQQHVRVRAGQRVEVAGEVFEVSEVIDRGDEQLLRLRLRPRQP